MRLLAKERFLTMNLIQRVVTFALVWSGVTSAYAKEPVLEFLGGLRQRGYYDIAINYLDQVENDATLDPEVRAVLPYERAQTLLQSASQLRNLDDQRKQLNAAQAAFEKFLSDSPEHALAGEANTARGRILIDNARVEIFDGNKPSNTSSREVFMENAREMVRQARIIFHMSVDQHEKSYKSFPSFIDETENKEQYAARAEAESKYIYAKLDLAKCKYWEAQTYAKNSTANKKLLTEAALEFEKIYEQHRTQAGGLYARMMQGKSFEEQDEIRIALGIYEEFLGHEGSSELLRNLKDMALHYRLICLNHEQRNDYKLVVIEAEEWLRAARSRSRTTVGLGIQWELSRALEQLGADRSIPEPQRRNHLTEALNIARLIARYPGELKTPAAGMIQRLMKALDRDPSDPKDFDGAYVNAGQLYEEVSALNLAINQAKDSGKMSEALEKQNAKIAVAAEMTRLYDLALKFADAESNRDMVNLARLRLAYGYLLQEKYFEAAAAAQFLMDKFGKEFPEAAPEAGFIAMTAFDYAYSESKGSDRSFEAEQVTAIAEKLAQRWPESGRANDARNAVAKIHFYDGDLVKAAEWWEQVPSGSSDYPAYQIRAGKAYWRLYNLEAAKPEEERASAEELQNWKQKAIERFATGISESEKVIPEDKPLPDEVVGAKVALASIRNMDGLYETPEGGPTGALDLLTAGPHSVLKSVEVAEGEKRPIDPLAAKSREMASFAYQQLLRTYIGMKKLDEARTARQQLESLAGDGDAAALTQIFVDFGRELQQELDRLKAAGDEARLAEVRDGFEAFLNDLSSREDGQTYYSMLWIAETYASLGEGSRDNQQKEEEFFAKASDMYQQILSKAAKDPKFVGDQQQVLATKLRLVTTLRKKPDFPAAEKIILEILKQSPNSPDAQFEAAQLYQEWGAAGGADALSHFETSIAGNKAESLWGWAYTAQALQRALYSNKEERFAKLHSDARYNLAEAEYEFGQAHLDDEKATEHLRRAQAAISGFQRISARWSDEEYDRFNDLYRKVLTALGSPVVSLPRDIDQVVETPTAVQQTAQSQPSTDSSPESETEADTTGSNALLIIVMLLVGGGAVAGLYFMAVGQNKRRYAKYKSADGAAPRPVASTQPVEQINFGNIDIPEPGPTSAMPAIQVASPAKSSTRSAKPTSQKARPAPEAAAPEKKKRSLTEEEIKKIKAARAAKAAQQQQAADPNAPKKKRPPKPPSTEA